MIFTKSQPCSLITQNPQAGQRGSQCFSDRYLRRYRSSTP